MEKVEIRKDIIILILLSVVVLFWNLGGGSLTSWDEAIYGEVSHEMLINHNWLDLTRGGLPWSDKPPLYMWITAVFYLIFGVTEFAVRLFPALCGIGTAICTYLLALRSYGRRAAASASLMLLTTWAFIWSSRVGMLDMPLTFFITLSILFFEYGAENRLLLFLCPLAFAAAFFSKSMGALLSPMVLFFYVAFTRKWKTLLRPELIWGSFIAFGLIAWWHILAIADYGKEFISQYFIKHLITRTTHALDGHTGNCLTYFGVIPNKGRPWGLLGMLSLPVALVMIFFKKEKEHILPVTWASVIFLLFSCVKTKLFWYIVPIFPPLSMLSGWAATSALKKHTIKIVSVLAAVSVLYLAGTRHIFNPDYAPESKRIALRAINTVPSGKTLHILQLGDPSMQFYLGRSGKFIVGKKELDGLLSRKGTYIITPTVKITDLSLKNITVIFSDGRYSLIETE